MVNGFQEQVDNSNNLSKRPGQQPTDKFVRVCIFACAKYVYLET
jgi:hypothetical protein